MSIAGKWNIEISSPMGAQKATLDLAVDGDSLTGTQSAPQGEAPVEAGKAIGDKATWKASVKSPMPMTLEFDVTVEGDAMTGTVKAGAFGSFPVKGQRI